MKTRVLDQFLDQLLFFVFTKNNFPLWKNDLYKPLKYIFNSLNTKVAII